MVVVEKPQLDLHEFLEQIGVVKGGDREADNHPRDHDRRSLVNKDIIDHDDEAGGFGDHKSLNWEALFEMHGEQGIDAATTAFQICDVTEELTFPSSIWNF